MAVEGVEQAAQKIGAEAGGDQSHDLGCVRHNLKMAYRVACGEWRVGREFRFKLKFKWCRNPKS